MNDNQSPPEPQQHNPPPTVFSGELAFRAVQEASPDGFMAFASVRDAAGRIVDFRWLHANAAAERIIGRPRSELLGRQLLEAMPGNRSSGVFDGYVRVVETGEPWTQELTYQHEGLDIHVRLTAAKAGDGFAVSFADLTELRRAEALAQASEERYRAFVTNSSEGVYRLEFDPPIDTALPIEAQIDLLYHNGRFAECNDAFARMYGFAQAAALIDGGLELMLPPDDPEVRAYLRAVMEAGYRAVDVESVERDRNGQLIYLANSLTGVIKAGQLLRAWGTQRDITARKRAEAELERLAVQRQLALDAARLGWWHYDPVQEVAWWDARYKEIFGITDSTSTFAELMARLHPQDAPRALAAIEAALDPAHPTPYALTCRIIRPDGAIRWIEAYGQATFEEAPGGRQATSFVGTVADITERTLAEERLRESEERYRTVLGSIAQGFCLLEMLYDEAGVPVDYRFVTVNPMFEHHTGLKDVVGKTALELIPDLEQRWVEIYGRVAMTGEPARFEQGSAAMERWFAVEAVRVGPEGSRKVALLFSDISAQKQAEADVRLLAEVSEHIRLADSPQAVADATVGLVGRHLGVRRCYLTEIDAARDRFVIQHEYYEGLPPLAGEYRLSDYPLEVRRALQQGQVLVVADAQANPRDAAAFPRAYAPYGLRARIVVPLLREGVWVSNLVAATDQPRAWQPREIQLLETLAERTWNAVEQLRAGAALRASEARLQELYAQEQAARAQAEEASRLKDEFLALVSHELRTPLTAFLGYAHLLRSRPRDEAYVARTVEKMVRSAQAQAQIIDDLLDVSRMVGGNLGMAAEPIDLITVVHAALDTVRPAVDVKGLRLEVDLSPDAASVIGDAGRLQQVLWNLLANAVKFTSRDGSIAVVLERDGRDAHLTVRDTGEGISPAFLPYVFDRFRQAEATSTRVHGGLGLGLAIVRHLVELHGGAVSVASAGVGQGASFTVRLPLADGSFAAIEESEERDADEPFDNWPTLAGLRVLVVDDQPDILALLSDILTSCGAEVELRDSADEGRAALESWRPDLLISDIAMPHRDGYWLIRAVRALPAERGGRIPAIALTAYVRGEERERVLAAGFQEYVPKPIAPGDLIAVVASLAGLKDDPARHSGLLDE